MRREETRVLALALPLPFWVSSRRDLLLPLHLPLPFWLSSRRDLHFSRDGSFSPIAINKKRRRRALYSMGRSPMKRPPKNLRAGGPLY